MTVGSGGFGRAFFFSCEKNATELEECALVLLERRVARDGKGEDEEERTSFLNAV